MNKKKPVEKKPVEKKDSIQDNRNETLNRKLEFLETAMTGLSKETDILQFMQDDNVFEIIVNPDQHVWVDTFTRGRADTGMVLTPEQSNQVILAVAGLANDTIIDAETPILSAEIPGSYLFSSSRFQGFLPNVVEAPAFNIRKHPKVVFSLEDYVKNEIMTPEQYNVILKAIADKKNIIAAGGTKSGKTTFLNALLQKISNSHDRIVIIEDTPELQCEARDHLSLRTMPHVDMAMLLRGTLRATPDRIVVGEVRGEEALDLVDAWSTGHKGGCASVHSNSAADTLIRLENMTSRKARNPQQMTISRAIDMIIYLKYEHLKRYVEEIISVEDYDAVTKRYITKPLA